MTGFPNPTDGRERQGTGMSLYGKIDLHIHSTVSDGSDTPVEIISCVKRAGIGLFSLTDHDAVKGCGIILEHLEEGDPAFICGVEFSCKDEMGSYHILGYGYDPEARGIHDLVAKGHSFRMEKVMSRLDFIKDTFGFSFPEKEIRELLARDNPGKPHIGNLMVKYGYAQSKEEAIQKYLNRLHIRNKHLRPEEAISGILASGGIPVLAHPFFGSGDQFIFGEEMENRLERLTGFGLKGVEAFYFGFSSKLTKQMLSLSERYQLFVTAGSDYHGKNKLVKIGNTGMTENSVPVPGMQRFLDTVKICYASDRDYTRDRN